MLKNNSPKAEPVVMYRRATAFVIVTFGFSLTVWLPVIASYRGWISVEIPVGLATLGIFAPAIAAILLRFATAGRSGLRSFWTAVSRWRIGRRWWVVTLLVPPVFIGGVYAAYLLFRGDIQMSTTFAMLRDAGTLAIIIVPVMVLVTIVLSFGEEAGWRGYLLPLLQSRLSALSASFVVGVVWFLWHIPLLYP